MKESLQHIAELTGGTLTGAAGTEEYTSLLTDSRSLCEARGTVFCALRTDAADGHRYIAEMAARGVNAFIVERVPEGVPGAFIRVPSVRQALTALAAGIRADFKGTVVAITGSAGKTVVKEMLYALTTGKLKLHRSPRSWNSLIGVPLTLTEMPADTQVEVVEVGIDRAGVMDSHARLLRPHIGVMTAITDQHDEGFASRLEKIEEKARLFAGCRTIVFDATDADVEPVLRRTCPDAQLIAVPECADPLQTDAAVARAVAGLLCPDAPAADDTLLQAVSSRLDVHEGVNDCLMVYDNFTHDVRSLRSALDFQRRRAVAGRSSTLILGDFSLENDDSAYARAAALAGAMGIRRVIGVGPRMTALRHMFEAVGKIETAASVADFLAQFDINSFSSETILISGDAAAGFADIKAMLENPRHDTVFEINLDAVVHNFNYYRSLVGRDTGLVAMVKASAYGTGAVGIARTLQAQGAAYLAVAVVDEGVELRRNGITMPIMVLNPMTTNFKALFDYRLEPSVFSLREFETLDRQARRYGVKDFPVHIKLDTGMHRVGFVEEELPDLLRAMAATDRLRAASVFSHLATADCLDMDDYTEMQLEVFERASGRIVSALPYKVKRHILNTAGIMRFPRHHYDMVRPGIGLYGISPVPEDVPHLHTVAALRTSIVSIRHWPAGTTIGYGRRGVLTRPSVIATVPIGYADGVNRHLGRGAASFIVRGRKAPTVGNICMDQCMIDITDIPDAQIGDSVEVFGPQNPVTGLAEILDTIPYELLTAVSPRVKRIYFRE